MVQKASKLQENALFHRIVWPGLSSLSCLVAISYPQLHETSSIEISGRIHCQRHIENKFYRNCHVGIGLYLFQSAPYPPGDNYLITPEGDPQPSAPIKRAHGVSRRR